MRDTGAKTEGWTDKRNAHIILYSAVYSQGSQAGVHAQEMKTLTESRGYTGFNFLDPKCETEKRRLYMFSLISQWCFRQSSLISLTRIYNVSADLPSLPFTQHWKNAQHHTINQCQPWTNFVLSGKFCSLGWAHYVPRFTSDLWLWSLPAGPNWSGFPFLFMFWGPSWHCRLSIGLAKLTCL